MAKVTGADAWLDAAEDVAHDATVAASTEEAYALAGSDIGSPVVAITDPRSGLFGPLVSPPPTGAQAVELFDAVVTGLRQPALFELKRGRHGPPERGRRP